VVGYEVGSDRRGMGHIPVYDLGWPFPVHRMPSSSPSSRKGGGRGDGEFYVLEAMGNKKKQCGSTAVPCASTSTRSKEGHLRGGGGAGGNQAKAMYDVPTHYALPIMYHVPTSYLLRTFPFHIFKWHL
jgi:hypothetical protein